MLHSDMLRKQIKPYLFGLIAIASLSLMVTFPSVNPLTSDSSLPALSVWTTSGMERVGMTDQPGSLTDISLFAARGEYEPFQIGIRAGQSDLTNVNVAISDLTGPNHEIIPSTSLTLYRQHYVYVDHPSPDLGEPNRPLGKGWYADALIPFVDPLTGQDLVGASLDAAPFGVEAGKNQPLWVDVFVPRNTPPGQYQGTYTVSSDQGSRSGKINLNVWNFALPLKASLNSVFLFHGDQTHQSATELLKHKLNPLFNGKTDLALERPLIDQWGLQSVGMRGFWSGAQQGNCQMAPAPAVAELQAEAALHQPDLFKYVYSADEIDNCPQLYEPMKQWGRAIHQAGLSNLVVMTPVPELYDDGSGTGRSAVDVWVVLPKMFQSASSRIQEVQRKGDQVWSYNSLVQDNYSPKWQIDFAPINFRIQPGFISQSLGLTGLLYWRVDGWTDDPWHNINTFFDRYDNNRPYPGDGMLFYPGQQVGVAGVVPSLRLKWIREGVEDYEYVQMLKRSGQTEQALAISRSVGSDWYNWTKDPAALQAARHQLAQAIENR